jgi:hypothetical protein
VQIGVAHAAGLGLDQDLARTGRRDVDFFENQRLAERFDDRGLHLTSHEKLPVSLR